MIVQLKASRESSGNDENETLRLKVSTYNFLQEQLRVVLLVKYVESENEAYYILLRDLYPELAENQKEFTVHIPKNNKLSEADWDNLAFLLRKITDRKLGAMNGILIKI